MSRIQKYKESLHRFIKDKSCLFDADDNDNKQINEYIYNKVKEDDLIFPILLLTIMNNQNKKNHMSMQGYYMATCIEFLYILFDSLEYKNELTAKFSNNIYVKLCTNLGMNSNRSLQQNLESIKNSYQNQPQNLVNIILSALTICNDTQKIIYSYSDFKVDITNKQCNSDITNWYLKNNTELIDKFKTFKQISKDSLQEYIETKYISLCEFSIIIGWIVGGGDIKDINKLKKLSRYFAIMYKISKDFECLDSDIKNSVGYTKSYVLNFGLQDGYEVFLNNKQKFIEESMVDDIYTNTIKEILDAIEINIDLVIDQTSPDLKSNYSNKT